jgi:hypothetical protein
MTKPKPKVPKPKTAVTAKAKTAKAHPAKATAARVEASARAENATEGTLRALGLDEGNARNAAGSPRADKSVVRAAVLRMLWDLVVDESAYAGTEPAWIESWLRWSRSQKRATTGVAAAIERVLARGVDPEDLTDIVRAMQYDVLLNMCDLVDGEHVAPLRERVPSLPEMSFRLYAVQEVAGAPVPVWPIESLHESIPSMDPTGREGEPRQR